MIRLSVIGSGNVAQHLIKVFSKSDIVELAYIFSRDQKAVNHLISNDKIFSDVNKLKPVDVVIIAVTDDAVFDVSSQLPFKNKLVVHTSGALAMDVLNAKNRRGVFYPLQTFSKSKEINFKEIPICIEAENDNDYLVLEMLAKTISNSVCNINSEQRKALHVAAVFVSNFTNYMYQIGNEICKKNNMSFDILKPLIQETANKILFISPEMSQTGPAKRRDTQTINAHLNFLNNNNHKEIYKMLTKSIIDNDKKL